MLPDGGMRAMLAVSAFHISQNSFTGLLPESGLREGGFAKGRFVTSCNKERSNKYWYFGLSVNERVAWGSWATFGCLSLRSFFVGAHRWGAIWTDHDDAYKNLEAPFNPNALAATTAPYRIADTPFWQCALLENELRL
eukprot:4047440-Amphidinium_carterae.1